MTEKFYEKLDDEYKKIPKYDIKMILKDYNAKIEREEIQKRCQKYIGKENLHKDTNENKKLLIDFVVSKNM